MVGTLKNALAEGKLLESTHENLEGWINKDFLPQWAKDSIYELIQQSAWDELNDRFYKTLEFGTGGMRGRTIGNIVPKSELGTPSKEGAPEHASVGSAYLNDFNIVKATLGFINYCQSYLNNLDVPKLVIAHDMRHYSRHFCELAASVWTQCGGAAFIFDGPRSTPQLSFSVRYLKATAGIVITASHNPPHDNGYKVYFEDGGQVVPPHADGIINAVNAIPLNAIPLYLAKNIEHVITLPMDADVAFQDVLQDSIIDEHLLKEQKVQVVFTPIHGTGYISAVPAMKHYGIRVEVVPQQMVMDPGFPTVKSPNPENPEAMAMGVKLAKEKNIEVVLATDPDGDRMGVAVQNANGEYQYLTGNNIGSLLLEYRLSRFKEYGLLQEGDNSNTALIKTFVTTPMQEVIADSYGLKIINTLTGFKWIGEKLYDYELALKAKLLEEEGIALDYDNTPRIERVSLLQNYSTYFAFGGEESYGYLAGDKVRDKDASAAALQFCELYSYLKKQDISILEYLDSLYLKYGYFCESLLNVYYEGASGSQKISNILASYQKSAPKAIGNLAVKDVQDFSKGGIKDADGKPIPQQDFFFVTLENGFSYAVRASGTEPKIKFYLFAQSHVASPEELETVKNTTQQEIEALKTAINEDAQKRADRAL